MPETIHAEYNIVTPMFIGDANQEATCIFPASVKGALRFWWRALNWGKYQENGKSNNAAAALNALHKQEGILFGSSAENGSGQSRFILRVKVDKMPPVKADWPKSGTGSGYLGMGLWESGKEKKDNFQAARQYLGENTQISIDTVLHPSISPEQILSLKDVLKIFGLLGGLGSRARRAFGSVALLELDEKDYRFDTVQKYKQAVHAILSSYKFPTGEPPYSAFTQGSIIGINIESKSTARRAHEKLGILFKQYRGRPIDLRGVRKRVFGMPYSGAGSKEDKARRASPLLMHIHRIKEEFYAVSTFLPARFHHDKALEKVDYKLISRFVDKFDEVSIK